MILWYSICQSNVDFVWIVPYGKNFLYGTSFLMFCMQPSGSKLKITEILIFKVEISWECVWQCCTQPEDDFNM